MCRVVLCGADGKASKCVVEVEKIKRRRQQRRAAQVAAREQQHDPSCITDAVLPGYGYDVMIASVRYSVLHATTASLPVPSRSRNFYMYSRCRPRPGPATGGVA